MDQPAKLEPFLLMGKSLKGSAAVKLISDATSAPGLFVFGELFDLKGIQELSTADEKLKKGWSLLELFTWGTFQDYVDNPAMYPELNEGQILKLKYLTLVTLARERRVRLPLHVARAFITCFQIIPYKFLLTTLQTPSIRALEDLIIDAIYLGILQAKLDQKEEQLEVEYTMGRDLGPGDVEAVLASLVQWYITSLL